MKKRREKKHEGQERLVAEVAECGVFVNDKCTNCGKDMTRSLRLPCEPVPETSGHGAT